MANSISVQANLEANMKMLSLTNKNADNVLSKNKLRDIEKSLKHLENLKDEIENLKFNTQTLMFSENKSEEEVSRYGEDVDSRLEQYSCKIDELQDALDVLKDEESNRINIKLEQEELSRMKVRYEEEKKIEEMKSTYRNVNNLKQSNSDIHIETKFNEPKVSYRNLLLRNSKVIILIGYGSGINSRSKLINQI